MASREGFKKLLRQFGYQRDHAALGREVARAWAQLTPAQRVEVQREEYRARIFAAGVTAGALQAGEERVSVLRHVADYLDLWAVEQVERPMPGSLEELAAEVLGAIRTVRNGEQDGLSGRDGRGGR